MLDGEAEIRNGSVGPPCLQRLTISTFDVEADECPGEGVESRREDQRIEFELAFRRSHTARRNLDNGRAAKADEIDMRLIEGFEVVRIHARAFDFYGMVHRTQIFGDHGILYSFSNLSPDEVRGRVVGFLA